MFGFIKNVFKKKKTPEELFAKYELSKKRMPVMDRCCNLLSICTKVKFDKKSKVAPDILISCFKELLSLNDKDAIEAATELIQYKLLESIEAQCDFINRMNNTKEWKELRVKQRIASIQEDFT